MAGLRKVVQHLPFLLANIPNVTKEVAIFVIQCLAREPACVSWCQVFNTEVALNQYFLSLTELFQQRWKYLKALGHETLEHL